MKKFFVYIGGALYWFLSGVCFATEKFEILPDLPEALAQSANATTVSKSGETLTINPSIGHEPTILSVVLSLAIVIILIYVTGIIYAKLNKAGFRVIKNQKGMELSRSQATVVSTTPLGNNKTLHVVELDGKRMLIGASNASIQLIKDLGTFSENFETDDYSNIEIPNIKIPKIEIPKIEIPSLKLSKIITKVHKEDCNSTNNMSANTEYTESMQPEDISQSQMEEDKDAIISTLFPNDTTKTDKELHCKELEHKVDPDEYALYMKYMK